MSKQNQNKTKVNDFRQTRLIGRQTLEKLLNYS